MAHISFDAARSLMAAPIGHACTGCAELYAAVSGGWWWCIHPTEGASMS